MFPIPDSDYLLRVLRAKPAHALHAAVAEGDIDKMCDLLASGYGINELHDDPCYGSLGTPLHVAVWSNQLTAFKILLLLGADINILDCGEEMRSEDTPMRLAARLGRREMFKRLWDAGADRMKYASSGRGSSLVQVAAYEGNADILQDLLSWDASWTHEDRLLALLSASRQWHVDAIATLLPRCRYSTTDLEMAIDAAVTSEGPAIYDYREYPKISDRPEEHSLPQAGVILLLLDEHARVGSKDGAAYDGSELLNRICRKGAPSPYWIAALKLVLMKGADPNARDAKSGDTALHRAFQCRPRTKPSKEFVVAVLLEHGARVDIRNEAGETPIDVARKHRHNAMVDKMMQHLVRMQETQD